MPTNFILLCLLATLLCTCGSAMNTDHKTTVNADATTVSDQDGAMENTLRLIDAPNPPAEGFDAAGSDAKAIAIADSIAKHYGGRRAWDDTRYLSWNFFGARTLLWDRHGKRARIEAPEQDAIYLLDYSGAKPTGRVRVEGKEIEADEDLREALAKANSMLINDSYWLAQQFKLKDSGVTLTAGEDVAADPEAGKPSYVLDMTFEGVGDTPQNRYRLYVDKASYMINTWQFFRAADDEEPAMQTPWGGFETHRGVRYSGDRGGRFQLTDIEAPATVDGARFTEF